jgi:hypothetical protein
MQDKLQDFKIDIIFAAKLEILILFILNGHGVVKRGVRFLCTNSYKLKGLSHCFLLKYFDGSSKKSNFVAVKL